MSDPFGCGYAVNHFGDPSFGYGYVVMQSFTPSHQLWYHWWVYVYIFSYGL